MLKFLLVLASLLNGVCDASEHRIRVAVLDTGINFPSLEPYLCKDGHYDATGHGIKDAHGHGSNIAAIIARGMDPKRHCLTIIKWYHSFSSHYYATHRGRVPEVDELATLTLTKALQARPAIINMSLSGNIYLPRERALLRKVLDKGIIVVVSAGNEGNNLSILCDAYPACYGLTHANLHVVENYSKNVFTQLRNTSNYGGPVTDREDGNNIYAGGHTMTGSSQAAALLTAKLIHDYPKSKH